MACNRFDDATLAQLSPKHQDHIRKRRKYDETVKSKAAAGAPLSHSAGTVTIQWLTMITGDPHAIASLEVKRRTGRRASRRRYKKLKAAINQDVPADSEPEVTSALSDGHVSEESEYVPVKEEKRTELRRLVRRDYKDADEGSDNAHDQELVHTQPVLTQPEPVPEQGQDISGSNQLQTSSGRPSNAPLNGKIFTAVKGESGNDADKPIELCASDDEAPAAIKVESSREHSVAVSTLRARGSARQAAATQSNTVGAPRRSPDEILLMIEANERARDVAELKFELRRSKGMQ
ncbi:hypothetical protein LTR17_011244 [Elasticomyces elasticus]|nr:hypothetical protein LTR17_011244 [Elasticomyces elasticus]